MNITNAAGICKAPIGVFDSGVGGLTVAREIIRNLPNERIVYFGDTARVPYGSKSKDRRKSGGRDDEKRENRRDRHGEYDQ